MLFTGLNFRLSLFYGAIFLVIGCYMPYFPLWLESHKLSAESIGLIVAAPMIVRVIITPLLSILADQMGDHRKFLIYLSLAALFSFSCLALVEGFWAIFFITLIGAMFWTTIMPLTETVAMAGVRESGLDYGRTRLWGSMAFIIASMGLGNLIDVIGQASILWFILGAMVLMNLSAFYLPKPIGTGRLQRATSLPQVRLSAVKELILSKSFVIFLLAASLVQATHALYYGFATLHWQTLGFSGLTIGLLWAIGVLAEICLFWFSKTLVKKWGAINLILIGAVATLLRWLVMGFEPGIVVLVPLQCLHALTFGATHLGAVHYISETVREDYGATAQGLYASFSMGIVMGGVMLATGWIYAGLQGQGYLIMAVLGLVGTALSLLLWRIGPQ